MSDLTHDEVLSTLRSLAKVDDMAIAHEAADKIILDYLDDALITQAFYALDRGYYASL